MENNLKNETSYFKCHRSEMLDFVPRYCKKILEIGCSEGLFGLQLIKRQDAEVWGIEPNKNAAKIASTRLFSVQNAMFDSKIKLPKKYFDCIILNDVLEHMSDPWDTLENIKRYLGNNESIVVLSIPNFRFWNNIVDIVIRKDFQYRDSGILDKTHYRFYTEKSIIRLFRESGFKILILSGINATESIKFKVSNILLLNSIRDMRFLQFAVVAKLEQHSSNK